MPAVSEPDGIGRYHSIERIGRGAVGTVYRALDPVIGRTVAIKVLLFDDDELRARFQQEVRAAGTLTHQHIVAIYDYGEADGRPYIVMEYVEGRTLADRLRDPAPFSLAEKVRLIQQLCAALDYAHARGVVHRDIKPANLMLDRHGDLKVVDFGIAKLGEEELTRAGDVLGTLMYMSPEQVNGSAVDRRTDVFSVGVVLYEILSLRHAFQGDTSSQVIRGILYEQPAELTHLLPDLDPRWNRIVATALHKDPAQRYQTAGELAADVTRISQSAERAPLADALTSTLVSNRSSEDLRPSAPGQATLGSAPRGRPTSQRRWAIAGLAFVVLAAIGASTWLAVRLLRPPSQADVAEHRGTEPAPTPATTPPVLAPPPQAATIATSPNPEVKSTDGHTVQAGNTKPRPAEDPSVTKAKIEHPVPSPSPTPFEQARAILAGKPTPDQKSTAVALLREACEGGEQGACLQAGLLYRDDSGMKNLPIAAQLFQRACDGGNADGCNDLAIEYARGTGMPKDDVKAATWFARACDGGVAPACTSLGRAYQAGRGVTQDATRARALFLKACESGGLIGCADGGVLLTRGIGGPADSTRAVAMFQRACDASIPVACANLSLAYSRGDGVAKDERRGVELMQRACDAGGAPACNNLAGMYADGRGVTKDLARAAALLDRSCDGNYADACQTLSQRYERGIGVEANPPRAAELARRATQLRATQSSDASAASGAGPSGTTTGGTAQSGTGTRGNSTANARGDNTANPGASTGRGAGASGVPGGVMGSVTGGIPSAPLPPAPPPVAPIRVGGDIRAPRQTRRVDPVYPAIARSGRIQGVVFVEATIGTNGTVTDARVIRSISLLDRAALDAVRQWEFTPTVVKGVAVPVIMVVTVSFTLQ